MSSDVIYEACEAACPGNAVSLERAIRAVVAADKAEQPAPATAGDAPEWCVDRIRSLVGIWDRDRNALHPHVAIKAIRWLLDKAESELARRVAESNTAAEHRIAQRDAEIERLKQELSALRAFKSYVHTRLDTFSVPSDPNPGETAKTGCRIGERLNWLFREFNRHLGESDRLKAGKFTKEELHNLCHNLHGIETARGFADGCNEEQRKFFGCAPDADEVVRLKAKLAKWESEPVGKMITDLRDEERESKNSDIRKLRSKIDELLNENAANVEENDRLKAELAESRKSGRAACESLADCIALKDKRTEERDKLKAELTEAKKRALPAGWEMSGTMVSRQDECERLTKENATLREQLAEATKPVELESANVRELDGVKVIYLGDAQAAVRRERAARIEAERRLALTREAWRHRWVSRDGALGPKLTPLTDADLDAAIAAHEKSKETSDEHGS